MEYHLPYIYGVVKALSSLGFYDVGIWIWTWLDLWWKFVGTVLEMSSYFGGVIIDIVLGVLLLSWVIILVTQALLPREVRKSFLYSPYIFF